MGSKHLRLAVALIELIYQDPQLSDEYMTTLDDIFMGMNLNSGALGELAHLMKWRVFSGGKDVPLEVACAHHARKLEVIMVKLLTRSNGKLTQGTAPKGPLIRKREDAIANTWRPTTRGDKDNTQIIRLMRV